MTTPRHILPDRVWQRQLHAGTIRRNSVMLKPAIWLAQRMRLANRPRFASAANKARAASLSRAVRRYS